MLRLASFGILVCLASVRSQPLQGDLWRDPGDVAALDFAATVGAPVGLPKAPFHFTREDPSGTQLKVFVTDSAGATWNVKFGYEVRPESFCWRVVKACGYFAEPSFFVAAGQFQGFQQTKRSDPTLKPDGRFTDGRFQYRDPNLRFLTNRNWRWDRGRWAGTKQLSGLKILIMLFSNYDNKDARVGAAGGPNTAVFERKGPKATEYWYAFTDWGSGLGRMGSLKERSNWNCAAFTEQSSGFVRSVKKTQVVFGYDGNINQGFRTGIPPAHVVWLMQYLGRVTDSQLLAGLKASGASDPDAACFTKALRSRIEQLRAVR